MAPSLPPLNYDVTGSGRRMGLMLLHPLGADRRFWDACVERWRGRVSCIAVDLRDAGAAGEPVGLEQHANDLEELRVQLGFDQIAPVGCAVSTMIAGCYAALYPASTHALVLSNATPRSLPAARAMLTERAAIVRAQGLAAILPQAVERAFLNQPHDERYWHYYEAFARQACEEYALACLASASYDATSYLPEVWAPSLVVSGAHDVLLPPPLGREVADLIPGAAYQILPDVAHFAPYQAPAAFSALVLRFLTDAGEALPTG